ncbi:four helix bundle protein [Candidatus Falkowbacteria bacterium]|nr:four helix bundle protein [Candidatus Falkowbacteria bacterium]
MPEDSYHRKLKIKIDNYIQLVYSFAKKFPKDELYGIVSQLRRAAVSVMLNYVEGYARRKIKVKLNFYEISYGSLKETKYLVYFSYKQAYINKEEYKEVLSMAEEIGAMLWSIIDSIDKQIEQENN